MSDYFKDFYYAEILNDRGFGINIQVFINFVLAVELFVVVIELQE